MRNQLLEKPELTAFALKMLAKQCERGFRFSLAVARSLL